MLIVKKVGIAGIGPFKKGVVLPIKPGVSFLYGKNVLNGGNSNAVGKTLLGTSINDTFYEPTVRHDRPKAGKRLVEFTKGKSDIQVVLESGKTDSVSISVNGRDVTPRTMSAAKAKARELWGLSQEEYDTYGFVDYALPHPLVKGNTATRKAFFTSFFGLDLMDAEKKVFAKQLLEVKKTKAAFAELETAFEAARNDMLSKEAKQKLEARLESVEALLVKLKGLQVKYEAGKVLETFKTLSKDKLKRLGEVTRTLPEVRAALKRAHAAQEQAEDYADYCRALKRYKEAVEGVDTSVPVQELASKVEKFAGIAAELKAATKIANLELVKSFTKVPKPEKDLATLEQDKRRFKHQMEHSLKFSEGVCDTCGQPVKVTDTKTLRRALAEAQAGIDAWAEYTEYETARNNYLSKRDKKREAQARVEELTKELSGYEKAQDAYMKRMALPPKPDKVEKPEGDYDLEAIRSELDITEFKTANEDLIERLASYKPVEFDLDDLTKAQEEVFRLKAKLDLHESVKKRALVLRDRLSELRKSMRKQEALELIISGYSDKAMKKMAIESISAHLMESVNEYAALVFENYSFEFVWGTQIQILVHRPEGTSDVRKLSGAESMLFTLILILSLLKFVPTSKRLNLITLDEPYASFSEKTADMFTALLPHITQVIPSVLIITPKSNFRVAGAHEYTAVKTQTGTVLRKGHPDAV